MKKIIIIFFLILSVLSYSENIKEAYFAGGCFWCMEQPFETQKGVIQVISGYSGGDEANPTYKEVSSGSTEHREAVKVIYDADIISYNDLLNIFWKQIDPTDSGGQFVDRGFQYTSAIFYLDSQEKDLAIKSKEKLEGEKRYKKKIVTDIIPFKSFYEAEDYHQDYYKNHKYRYKYYRSRSGRDEYLDSIWK